MSNGLVSIEIQNYRSIANLKLELGSLNVLFGPNGVGKSTFLDAVLFLADCVRRDVSEAAAKRGQGIGLLWDWAGKSDNILIALETLNVTYQVSIEISQGRIYPHFGESLNIKSVKDTNDKEFLDILKDKTKSELIKRKIGDLKASVYNQEKESKERFDIPSGYLTLPRYALAFPNSKEAAEMINILNSTHFYLARETTISSLKRLGSQSSHHLTLFEDGGNLWSVLRNLRDRSVLDSRYDMILRFMHASFPAFKNLLFEQTSPTSAYVSMLEEGRRQPIPASGMSDGHIQMLINLTALFSEEKGKTALILFDEPETSLHPHAIAQFAEAVKLATNEWGRQVFIATHSPVLLSQFEPENILTVGLDDNRATVMQRVSEIENIKDLLEEYALGSLYMAEAIAPQSKTFSEV